MGRRLIACAHGAHQHLPTDQAHRPPRRVLRGARLRGAPPDADPRRGDQRLHGPAGRRRQARADLQPRRRLLRARHGVQPHRLDRRRPRLHARRAGREGHRAREAAVPGARGRVADLLRARSGRLSHRAHREGLAMEDRLAVIDVGSNSFRLVVFTSTADWWKRTDEIHEAGRIGEGLDASGELQPEPMERALETLELCAHFCRATGIDTVRPVATSAIRDAGNQAQFLKKARKRSGLEVEVMSGEEEARYGYLAAINSTTLSQGVVLDLGGGSLQLTRVEDRQAVDARSWPLGAVRMTERFLPDGEKARRKQMKALREHVAAELEGAAWLDEGGRLSGVGGTVRNLAAARQIAAGLPSYGIQGFRITRAALGELIERFAELTAAEPAEVPGIKAARGDLILAGALVIDTVMEAGGFGMLEATDAGLREGVFFETVLGDPPRVPDVREATVCNLAAQFDTDFAHADHVARLSLELWDG